VNGDLLLPKSATDQIGLVLNIQRFSTEDGPGIRTTVFLMGCALRCQWCQNPETWSLTPQAVWYQDRCIGAQHCITACPQNALTLTQEGLRIDRERCNSCGECAPVCPSKAIELLGTARSVDDVVKEVLRDRPFYEESGGGVTLSGGDPLFQPQFAYALLHRFNNEGLHTVLDTAGFSIRQDFKKLVQQTDLVLFDLKLMDPHKHQECTGVKLETIIENAKWLGGQDQPVWIRTPIIPGFTNQSQNIAAIAAFIRLYMPNVERWDLLGFNKLCKAKWERLDKPFPCAETELVSEKQMTQLMGIASDSQIEHITWSGVTQESTE
jgi:pyruvate formate lyase activating enzyme